MKLGKDDRLIYIQILEPLQRKRNQSFINTSILDIYSYEFQYMSHFPVVHINQFFESKTEEFDMYVLNQK